MSTNIKNPSSIQVLVYSAICLALAFALSNIIIFRMPQGGSVTLASMLFIALVGYWFGIRAGLLAGLVFGFIQMSFGGYIITPIQGALDYIVAYAALGGIAGIFSGRRFGQYGLYIGYLLGVTGTFFAQYLSGILFFSHFAGEGQHMAIVSAIYNLSHNLPEVIITFAILALPNFKHALDSVALPGSICADNKLSHALQGKAIMKRLPYAIVSASLFASFFIFPLIHKSERISINASALNIAIGNGSLVEELMLSAQPLTFALLIAPAVMFVLTLMDKPAVMLRQVAMFGFFAKCCFALWAIFNTSYIGIMGPDYALTMSNVIVLAIYAGLISALKPEEKKGILP